MHVIICDIISRAEVVDLPLCHEDTLSPRDEREWDQMDHAPLIQSVDNYYTL